MPMKSGHFLLIILMTSFMTGCTTDIAEVKESELNEVFILNSSPTFIGYFYLGSDNTHHYFVSKWEYGRDKRFKVPKTDLVVLKEEQMGQREIHIFVWKPANLETDEFCVIGETRIYREQ